MKSYIKDSKMRSALKGAAQKIEPTLSLGKNSITPEFIEAEKHELMKIHVLKNCIDDLRELGNTIAERSGTELVQIIGRMIVLYKPAKEEKDRKFSL